MIPVKRYDIKPKANSVSDQLDVMDCFEILDSAPTKFQLGNA